ncbi:MAG: type III pantothenate kinase [Candidatus Symbiothrix sp.]|nr:type III pantothenate kinase [Candidatus Symbiothrix sp.]
MNITVDIGNSLSKIALFENDGLDRHCVAGSDPQSYPQSPRLVEYFQYNTLTEHDIQTILDNNSVDAGIVCSVKKDETWLPELLSKRLKQFYELTPQLPIPLVIDYQTPHTLGMDRIAAAVGAYSIRPMTDLLVIDIGTAITIDFVSSTGVYKGGNISPGPDLRFKALNAYTDRLPLVDAEGALPTFGYDTATAIRSGVIGGIVRELDTYIDEQKKNAAVFAFLTGGYAFYFENKLSNRTFADENLVLKGLNTILNENSYQLSVTGYQ